MHTETAKKTAAAALARVAGSLAGLVDTSARCLEKAFSGRFLLALASAYGIIYIIENGSQTDPLVASIITLIVKSYFDKDSMPGPASGEPRGVL